MEQPRRSYLRQFLLASLLLHIGIILFLSDLISLRLFETLEKKEEPILVEVFEEKIITVPSVPIEKPRRRAAVHYKDLWFIPHGKDGIVAKQIEGGVSNGVDGLKHIHVAEYVYQIIDGRLHYPGEFIEKELEGVVTADLPFDENGRFLHSDLSVKSSSGYLRVYVHRLLRSSLIYSLPSNIINYKGKYILKANFRFASITLDDDDLVDRESYFSGSSLFFYRYYVKSPFSWSLGPVSGNYYWHPDLSPDLFQIDVIAAADFIHFLITKKKRVDSFEKYRNDPAW